MRILKESKDQVPAEFITSFISKGWEEVGALKAEIAAIGKEFVGTKAIEETLQGLLDAYLVAIGQFEGYLTNKNLIEAPEESKAVSESLTEDLEEDTNINIDKVDVNVAPVETKMPVNDDIDILAGEFEDDPEISVKVLDHSTPVTKSVPVKSPEAVDDEFDYFCDFEDPDPEEEPLTDEDLYPTR